MSPKAPQPGLLGPGAAGIDIGQEHCLDITARQNPQYPAHLRQQHKPQMRLISFKPLVKGSLRGFANVELPIGLRITDCPVLTSNGKAWATLPSKPVLDRDGKHVEVSGKKQYAPILEWRDRDLSNRFSAAIVDLVRQHHPDALDESMAA